MSNNKTQQKNKTLLLTVGAPGSGKSTWAEEQCKAPGVVNINRDNLRGMIKALSHQNNWKYTKANEKFVTDVTIPILETLFKNDNTNKIIVSDTNLNPSTFLKFKTYAEDNGYFFETKDFPLSWKDLLARNLYRGEKAVPISVLRDMSRRMRSYMGKPTYLPNTKNRKAIIVDIDGTVANNNGRHPFAWDLVKNDLPIKHVIDLVRMYAKNGYDVIFVSGRDGVCYDDSLEWIKTHVIEPDAFFMRETKDSREDSIVKEEIFWRNIAHRWNVEVVIDDRATVVEMWRSLGLTCFQVNDGDF